ncbi:disintegrin and metalloproteinase domain-containing protein 10-like [Dermacentor variabilis]|uniref:disintegrin and metalloproteinase domain-containing protein 10-like n=1 Tax=Dermacentor variabilis TaxID=34621 RepID=UPI003F5B3FBC
MRVQFSLLRKWSWAAGLQPPGELTVLCCHGHFSQSIPTALPTMIAPVLGHGVTPSKFSACHNIDREATSDEQLAALTIPPLVAKPALSGLQPSAELMVKCCRGQYSQSTPTALPTTTAPVVEHGVTPSKISACRNIYRERTSDEQLAALTIPPLVAQPPLSARRLNRFVRHFEPLSYEPRPVHRGHVRVRRSLGASRPQQQQQPEHVYVRFQGFSRLFHLKLKPDTSVFNKDLVVETAKLGRVKPNIDHIYSGEVVGDPSSRVFGGLHNGVFEGSIQSRWGRFYVEGAHKFFARRTPFHSVMYAAEDASVPHEGWCGVRGETARWMQQLATASAQAQKPVVKARRHSSGHPGHWIGRRPLAQEQTEDYYNEDADDVDDDAEKLEGAGDGSRGAARRRTYRVCGLYVQIDHLLYRQFNERDNDPVHTRQRLSTLIAGHVARASDVYRRTDFNGVEDVTFNVHMIKINDTKKCPSDKNPYCLDKMDPALYLLTTAKSANYDDYCLAYSWTYRDFDDGVLGLAYVGNASSELCLRRSGRCRATR